MRWGGLGQATEGLPASVTDTNTLHPSGPSRVHRIPVAAAVASLLMLAAAGAGWHTGLAWRWRTVQCTRTLHTTPQRAVVLLANAKQVHRALATIGQIRDPARGAYNGTLVLVGGDDWAVAGRSTLNATLQAMLTQYQVEVRHFPDLNISHIIAAQAAHPLHDNGRCAGKRFQFHKFYLFHPWFKRFDVVLYADAGCNVARPIEPFFHMGWRCGARRGAAAGKRYLRSPLGWAGGERETAGGGEGVWHARLVHVPHNSNGLALQLSQPSHSLPAPSCAAPPLSINQTPPPGPLGRLPDVPVASGGPVRCAGRPSCHPTPPRLLPQL